MTLGEALAQAGKSLPAFEARLLLQDLLGVTAVEVAAHPERALGEEEFDAYMSLVGRRVQGEPIAYLTGRREFYGRDFTVSAAVLIPRPETELLVETGIDKLRAAVRPRVLDLGTGSGCLAVTLALELAADVTAVDLSADGLAVARANVARHGVQVRLLESDWFSAVTGRFDLIVTNPPYVAEGDPHLGEGDLRFEPATALASGADGLSAIRRIVAKAPDHLAPNAWLFFEHGYDQGPAVRNLLLTAGFVDVEQHRDLAGIVRVSGGRLTAPPGCP